MQKQSQLELLKKSEKVAVQALWLEGALVLGKIAAAFITGSMALISDAVHSASDIISILTSWLGLKISQKKPNEKFPYGFYKAENLATLIISLLIIYAGYEMVMHGIESFGEVSKPNMPLVALAISLIDAIILFFFGNYEVRVGEETNSQSLTAMGRENRTHIFSSGAVFLGVLSATFNIPYVENVVTLIISLLIFEIGFSSLKNSVLLLMDVSPDLELEAKLKKELGEITGVEEVVELKLRQAGSLIFGDVTLGVRHKIDVQESQKLIQKAQALALKILPSIDNLAVVIKPFQSDYKHLVIPVSNKKGFESKIAPTMARAKFFLCINLKQNKIIGHYFLENPYTKKDQQAGLQAAKLVAKTKSDSLIAKEIGEIAFFTLKDSLFNIYQTSVNTAQQAIDKFLAKDIAELAEPSKKSSK